MQTIKTILLLLTLTLISHANLQPQTTPNNNTLTIKDNEGAKE